MTEDTVFVVKMNVEGDHAKIFIENGPMAKPNNVDVLYPLAEVLIGQAWAFLQTARQHKEKNNG